MWTKYQPVRAPEDGTGSANAGATGGANSGASGGATGGNGTAAPWYGDKVDAVTLGYWQNKGIDPKDPVVVATKMTEFYRNAESKIGAPPEEMIRIPKANAAEADINAYWQKIGWPAEAKDYDLSTVKRADGKDVDQALVDEVRGALHEGRVSKDRAAGILTRIVKRLDADDAARLADRTAITKSQQEALDKNWGTNKTYNMAIAQRALEDLGKASGLTPDQARMGWDAISSGQHIGGAYAMEMLRTIAARMGEQRGLIGSDQQTGDNKVMSKAQALAEIESLKKDRGFYERLMKGDVASKRQWSDLHKIAFAA